MSVKSYLPYGAFTTCCLIWGSTFLFIGLSNQVLPPMWGLALRLMIAGTVLSAILVATRTPVPRGAALRAAVGYGVFDFGISMAMLYYGEMTIPTGLAAVLYGTAPIFSMIMETVLKTEKLSIPKLMAAVVALGGVGVIFAGEVSRGAPPLGILSVLGAVAFAVASSFFLKLGPPQSPVGANAVGALAGLPFVLAASFLSSERQVVPSTAAQWVPVLYLALVGSAGAFVVFVWLLARWKVSTVSFIAVVIPIIAVSLGAAVRNERFAPESLIGAAIVLAATVFVLRMESQAAGRQASS